MLTLLVGPDRAALSRQILSQICADAAHGKEGLIYIVPEQFSHEAERNLCLQGGDSISRYAEVLSLSRLSDRVAAYYGGAAGAYLDKGGQLLAMALAAEQVSSRIKLYASVLRKPEFLADMVKMVGEFRSYCLEPRSILEAAGFMEGAFSQKLEELGLLYEAYLAVCANGKADPSDKLIRLRDALTECDWAQPRWFYLDGFSDFTGAELDVLEVLLQKSEHVWISLTEDDQASEMMRLTRETEQTLKVLAGKSNCACRRVFFGDQLPREAAVQTLLEGLFTQAPVQPAASQAVRLRSCSSVEEECRETVQSIRQLLSQGARCREISVACTDLGLYEAPLRAACSAAGLPVYFAGETDLLATPIISAVLNALNAAAGPLDYEDAALYLKSGLPLLEQDRCDQLDLYAYRWNLRGSQWETSWELHPRGFGELWTEQDRAELAELNDGRERAFSPLIHLRRRLRASQNTGEMVLALDAFLEELQLRQRLEQKANRCLASGQGQAAQELIQLYEIVRQSLEQTWLILGQTTRSPEDFCRLYRLLLTQYRVGTIPAGLDQVHISDLPDLRYRTTKHLLVLGASDGSFPSYRTTEGILTEDERRRLAAHGVSLAPSRSDQMDQEMCRIRAALYAALDSVTLSCAGEQPAWLFRRASAMYPDSLQPGRTEVFLDLAALAAWRLRHKDTSAVRLRGLDAAEQALRQLRDYRFTPLEQKTVQGLYGRQIYLSASRIDKYAACRFAFFLAYGLKAQPRRQAKLDPSVFGTFVHAVLEQVVKRVTTLGGFHEITQETLLELATEEINQYTALHFPEQAKRDAYLFHRSKEEILDIVLDLGQELRGSLFQPVSCELEFSQSGALPPVSVQGQNASCVISGFVDRVDLYERDGKTYVRVVDYKTGKKDFDYTDILNGAGMQMLIYLFALRQYGASYFGKNQLEPAGVLYLPARKEYTLTQPMPDSETVSREHREERRRRGLIRGDADLLAAMEAEPDAPRYMPYEVGKNGVKGDVADSRQMILLERHVIRTLVAMTDGIAGGNVTPNPMVRGQHSACRFCDYAAVCHRDLCQREERNFAATPAAKFWEKLEQEEDQHG